jgi:hypothetical protein
VKGRLDNPASHRQSLLARRTALKRYWANPGGAERGGDGARDTACDRLKPGMQAGGQAASEGHLELLAPFEFRVDRIEACGDVRPQIDDCRPERGTESGLPADSGDGEVLEPMAAGRFDPDGVRPGRGAEAARR